MTHPLTDEIIEEIEEMSSHLVEMTRWFEEHPDGYEHDCRVVGIRSAADWQLEQVIEWLRANDYPGYQSRYLQEKLIQELKKAMRPQEDN